jgi:DNA polymerase-3 subunit alpha
MGKKIQSEMDAQRARFIEGCAKQRHSPEKANELFDLIDKFAGYGFNKSTRGLCAVAYHTAWLKRTTAPNFYAASMSFDSARRTSWRSSSRMRPRRDRSPAALRQSQPRRFLGGGRQGSLCPGALKRVGEGAMEALCGSAKPTQLPQPRGFRRRIDPGN